MENEPTYKKWDFIRQMRGIFKIKNSLTLAEYKLLTTLFEVNNDQGRRETFQVDNKSLAELAGMKTPNIVRLRQSLQAKGFISCEAGKKGKPTAYRMRILYDMGKGYHEATETENKGYHEATQNYHEATLNYHDDTQKASKPLAYKACETPKRLVKGVVKDICTSDQFATFYKSYPKKKGKKVAERAFLKLKPDADLFQKIMAALEVQKKSPDWQKDGGKYIPYPATWLNGERWEDELEEAPPPEVPFSLEEQAARQRAEDERQRQIMERID